MKYPETAKLAREAFEATGAKTHEEFTALFHGAIGLRTFRAWLKGENPAAPLAVLVLGEGQARLEAVEMIEQRAFTNMVRSLFNIDAYQLPELTAEQQTNFIRDPVRYFIGADKVQADAIFREVMKRQAL